MSELIISTTLGWIAMTSGKDIHGFKRMDVDFSVALTCLSIKMFTCSTLKHTSETTNVEIHGV